MDIRKVKKLIELLEASSVDEIEIKEGEESVRISRNKAASIAMAAPVAAPAMPAPLAPAPAAPVPVPATPEAAAPSTANAVTSPMVGTFYRSPSPGAPAFVEVGQSVRAGDVLCIVEAMKMETEVRAGSSGTVASVDVAVGDSVAVGQTLITLS